MRLFDVRTASSSAAGTDSQKLLASAQTFVESIVDRFGVVLPVLVLTLLMLAVKYNNRVLFTHGKRDGIKDIPGGLPLIGHTHYIIKNGTVRQFERFGELAQLSATRCFRITFLGVGSMIFVNRPEYIEYVQKTNFENFPKGYQFKSRLGDLLGHDGIFVADGDVWRKQRKLASHMFSANEFNNWVKQVVHHELDNIDALLSVVASRRDLSTRGNYSTAGSPGQFTAAQGGVISMPELFFRYTLSSFAKMAFSADVNCLTSDPASLKEPVEFATAFDFAQGCLNERFVNPFYSVTELITPKGFKLRKAIRTVQRVSLDIINQRLATDGHVEGKGEKNGISQSHLHKDGKDLLALFMEHTTDPQALMTVVLNFIIAGRDTTAQTLSWLFYELAAHPEHVVHIRQEIDAVLGPDAAEQRRWVQYEEFKKLPYTLACVHEAARLHPAVPKNGKEVLVDDCLVPQGPNPNNLPPIPVFKGERIGWSDWVMNRLPEVWGEDAAQFNPQRFLVRDSQNASGWTYQAPSQWKFHVFNGGPRLCLGMNLAGFEAVAFVAATLPKYDFTWTSPQQGQTSVWPPEYANSLTHPMKHNYQCIVTPRASAK